MCQLPFEVEFLLDVDFARVWGWSIQPEGQAIRRIRPGSDECLTEQVRGNNLLSLIIAMAKHQFSEPCPLPRAQFKSGGWERITASVFFKVETRSAERRQNILIQIRDRRPPI